MGGWDDGNPTTMIWLMRENAIRFGVSSSSIFRMRCPKGQMSSSLLQHATTSLLLDTTRRVARVYGCGLFTFTYRLRGNARSFPGLRRTLKLNMYDRRRIQKRSAPSREVEVLRYFLIIRFTICQKQTYTPLTGFTSRRGRHRPCRWPQHETPALKCDTCAATRVGSVTVSPDRPKRCANS